MGSTDISFSIITGGNWFKVPESIKVNLVGKPGKHIYGKDIILELIRILGVDGALYKAIEFTGEGVQYLGMADRFSMCNMAIEAGAKSGIFAIDAISQNYLDV
jgi:3-isopropylmalate/(R)-2-methylmalate dehydratase large subunit